MNYFLNTHDFFPISCSHSKLQYIFLSDSDTEIGDIRDLLGSEKVREC